MAVYSLRRFAHADGLKAISPGCLLAFLEPYRSYLGGRELTLPQSSEAGLDYDRLVAVLMSPGRDTPEELLEALFLVHEMATQEGMEVLLDVAENHGVVLEGPPDPTAADVAVQVYLQDRVLLERTHAERYLVRPRCFQYFRTTVRPVPPFRWPSRRRLAALEKDLDDWFERRKRGRVSRVFAYSKNDSIWFLVRHGDPFRREGSIEEGRTSSVFYRPEKHDVLVYEPVLGEIRMHACSKGERDIYRVLFGRHLFADEDFFPDTCKFSLEPLRRDGPASVVCTDVDGMDWVRLQEIRYFRGGTEKEVEVRRANDLFVVLEGGGRGIPARAPIIRASFQVKFNDSKTARSVTISPSNTVQYARDSDADVVETWLRKRGFICTDSGQ